MRLAGRLPGVGRLLRHRRRLMAREGLLVAELAEHRYAASRAQNLDAPAAPRKRGLVVSLTSHGARLAQVHRTIESLLAQSLAPEHLILWLDADDAPSPQLQEQAGRGLQIGRAAPIGSYRKLLPSLAQHPGHCIVTADDDLIYPPDWLAGLVRAYDRQPQLIQGHRGHLMRRNILGGLAPYSRWRHESDSGEPSHRLLLTSGAGMLFPPGSLADEVHNAERALALCPGADDLWFAAMALLGGSLCRRVPGDVWMRTLDCGGCSGETPLWAANKAANDRHLKALIRHYDLRF